MAGDRTSGWEPTYPSGIHPDVARECRDLWLKHRPWTHLQVLRKGVDDSSGAVCERNECRRPVEAVQYTTAFGDPAFFCADHAVEQEEHDVMHYDSRPRPPRELSPEHQAEIDAMLRRMEKKKLRQEHERENTGATDE